MTDRTPTYADASNAIWAAEKAVERAQRKNGPDVTKKDFTGLFMHALHILAVEVACADGELSPAECVAINNIFWLSKTCPDPWTEQEELKSSPDLADAAMRALTSWARFLCRCGGAGQEDPGQNLLCQATELMLQTVLAADTNAQPEVDRLTQIVQALRQTVAEEAANIADREGTQPAPAPVPAPAAPLAPPADTLASILAELDGLTGLARVKHEVGTIVNLAKVFKLRRKMGMPVPDMSLHLVFLGNPGTGKTMVARIVAHLYSALGLLSKSEPVEVDRSGLVGDYIGQTATKVAAVVQSALGGVLFIDEAYTLATGSQNDYGQEAVATLLKAMEDHRADLVVIAAGYTDQMQRFLDMNPGLESRMARKIAFDDYTPGEMVMIFKGMTDKARFVMAGECEAMLLPLFQRMWENRGKDFANARDVRNLFEQVIDAQANRIGVMADPVEEDVCAIIADDLRTAAGASDTI